MQLDQELQKVLQSQAISDRMEIVSDPALQRIIISARIIQR